MEPKPTAARLLQRTFSAFRYRDFRILWLGAFTSTTGNLMQQVAQSWLIFQLTGLSFYLGLTSFLAQFPLVLFSVVGGALADRVDRRRLLLFSQAVQMTTAFILTTLIFFDVIEIWHFLVLVFVAGLGQAFGGPAHQALIPGLVKRQDVPNAIALNSIQFNLARVAGPMLAAVVMAALGAVFCFALNGLSFLAVMLSLLLIKSTFRPQKTEATMASQIKEGIRFVLDKRSLRQLMLLGFVSTFCGVPLLTLLPVFVKNVYQMGEVTYSWMMSIAGSRGCGRSTALCRAGRVHSPGAADSLVTACPGSSDSGLRHLESLDSGERVSVCRWNLSDRIIRLHHIAGSVGHDRRDERKGDESFLAGFQGWNAGRRLDGRGAGRLLLTPCRDTLSGYFAGLCFDHISALRTTGQAALGSPFSG